MSSSALTDIIAALGGPLIEPSEIDWATHLPAGQKLIQWLVDQCIADDQTIDTTALHVIALERNEVKILNNTSGSLADIDSDAIYAPPDYLPPSRLLKHAEHLDRETRLLEAEANRLKARIQQTKKANRESVRTIEALQKTIDNKDAAIAQAQERLADISVLADTTLLSAKSTAFSLLNTLGYVPTAPQAQPGSSTSTTHPSLNYATSSLASLASLRTSITSQYTAHMEHIQSRRGGSATNHTSDSGPSTYPPQLGTLPSPDQLSEDASLLEARISSLLEGISRKELAEKAFRMELERMCEKGLDNDIDGNEEEVGADWEDFPLDVRAELERAWAIDQSELLDFESQVLDSTIQEYKERLLPQLTALHDQLGLHEREVQNAGEWIGVLGLEVESLREEVEDARAHTEASVNYPKDRSEEERELELENRLRRLLVEHHQRMQDVVASRGKDDEPLILIDREDILAELNRFKGETEEDEARWTDIDEVRKALSRLSAADYPLLSSLYRNSPTNTSPPFSSSPFVAKLENDAREAEARLSAALGRDGIVEELQKMMDSSRTKRKLGAFVDRWTSKSSGG